MGRGKDEFLVWGGGRPWGGGYYMIAAVSGWSGEGGGAQTRRKIIYEGFISNSGHLDNDSLDQIQGRQKPLTIGYL